MTAGARLTRRSYLGWETRRVAAAGIRNSDVTGGASGGGVVAFPINDLAPPLFGLMAWALGAARIFFVVCGCAVCVWALGFAMGYRKEVDEAATHDGLGADRRPRE